MPIKVSGQLKLSAVCMEPPGVSYIVTFSFLPYVLVLRFELFRRCLPHFESDIVHCFCVWVPKGKANGGGGGIFGVIFLLSSTFLTFYSYAPHFGSLKADAFVIRSLMNSFGPVFFGRAWTFAFANDSDGHVFISFNFWPGRVFRFKARVVYRRESRDNTKGASSREVFPFLRKRTKER